MMNKTLNTLINQSELEHLHEGSVKSIYQKKENLFFLFSDRYSIYDWGEMPDQIEQKGNCLSIMAELFFQYLASPNNWETKTFPIEYQNLELLKQLTENGLVHHCRGLRQNSENKLFLEVEKFEKYMPTKVENKWIYSGYNNHPTNSLVPLEVIFRLGAPKGSSYLKRNKDVSEGDKFNSPIIEFSTKLEPQDRALTNLEAIQIAGLSEFEFKNLTDLTALIALNLEKLIANLGLELWDGKFEFSFSGEYPHRSFKIVDSIGLDELRITIADNFPLSKEFARQCYINSEWYKEITFCKKEYGDSWKSKCQLTPSKLSKEQKRLMEFIYQSFTNQLSLFIENKTVFNEKYNISNLKKEIKNYQEVTL